MAIMSSECLKLTSSTPETLMQHEINSDEDSSASPSSVLEPAEFPKRYQVWGTCLLACGIVLVLAGGGGGYLRVQTQGREPDSSHHITNYLGDEHQKNATQYVTTLLDEYQKYKNSTEKHEDNLEVPAREDALKAQDSSYWSSGSHKHMTVYHQTSPEICGKIMASNFHIGRGGLCGRAIYFALSPEATSTKAITANSHGGCMIEAVVDVGRQDRYYWTGRPQRGEKYCGGWNEMNAAKLHKTGADSIIMRQGDGDEIIVFEPERIISKKVLQFDCKWMCRGRCQKHWPSYCHR